MEWIQLLLGAISFGLGAAVIPEKKFNTWIWRKAPVIRLIFSLFVLTLFILFGFLLRDLLIYFSGNLLVANTARAFVLGGGACVFFDSNFTGNRQEKNHFDFKKCSYIDEEAGKAVLRSSRYPKKRSREWIVSNESILFRVVGNEKYDKEFLISDITKIKLSIRGTNSMLQIEILNHSKHLQLITVEGERETEIAKKMKDYILEINPNILSN